MHLPHITPFRRTPIYFFTCCTAGRQRVLANAESFSALREVWARSAHLDGWHVGRFVLMPDHVHFFAVPEPAAKPRCAWHKMWKSVTARRLARALSLEPPLWQDDTFDHILRHRESYAEKWRYVRDNPIRAGLCRQPDDWPWQGEIEVLSMR